MVFPRQEYWSGLPFPSPRDRPNPGIKHASPALAGRFFTTENLYLGSPYQVATENTVNMSLEAWSYGSMQLTPTKERGT